MKRLLLPLLAAIALPTAVNANVDPKVAEMCMKAADFQGCVRAMTGENLVTNQKEELLNEIKILPSRISNTSLVEFSRATRSFRDKLALSSPEEVGLELYQNAKKLELALDELYRVRDREVQVKSYYWRNPHLARYGWDGRTNYQQGQVLNSIFGGLTIDVRCFAYGFSGAKGFQDFPTKVSSLISIIAKEIANSGGSYSISKQNYKISANDEKFCPDDPRKPKKVKKEDSPVEKKKPVKINCNSPVWKKKPICN